MLQLQNDVMCRPMCRLQNIHKVSLCLLQTYPNNVNLTISERVAILTCGFLQTVGNFIYIA